MLSNLWIKLLIFVSSAASNLTTKRFFLLIIGDIFKLGIKTFTDILLLYSVSLPSAAASFALNGAIFQSTYISLQKRKQEVTLTPLTWFTLLDQWAVFAIVWETHSSIPALALRNVALASGMGR